MIRDHPVQKFLEDLCIKEMETRMKDLPDPSIAQKIFPSFKPGCRRLSPGDGYLEAFGHANASMCWDPIDRITAKGIKTTTADEKEKEEEFDMIVCATGFDTSFIPPLQVRGTGRRGLGREMGR